MISVHLCLYFFERGSNGDFQFIKQGSLKSVAEESEIKVGDFPPEAMIGEATLRDETVDMRVPFERPAESMQNTDKTGSEVHGLILLVEETENDRTNGMEKTIQSGAVFFEKVAKFFRDCKDTVPVITVDQFTRHSSCPFPGIEIPAGRAKAALAAERDKFPLITIKAMVHGAAQRRITTVDHLFDIFHLCSALGRCGCAYAMLDRSMMPEEEREDIGQIRPSGWTQEKYEEIVLDYATGKSQVDEYQYET